MACALGSTTALANKTLQLTAEQASVPMATTVHETRSRLRTIVLIATAWFFKIGGFIFAFAALFALVGKFLHLAPVSTPSADTVALVVLAVAAIALLATGILLAKRARAGAILALVLNLYPLAFVLAGQRAIAWFDVVFAAATVAVVCTIWPELRGRTRATR